MPTAVKLLRGITRKDRLNPSEAKPPDDPVVKPEGLSEGASAIWDRMAPICIYMRTLTTADIDPFVMMCELQAEIDRATKAKQQPGCDLDKVRKIYKDFAPIIRQYYALFGMDPMSRARMAVPKAETPVSKWAAGK